MNYHFDLKDDDGDYLPLTREEKRSIYLVAGIAAVCSIIAGIIIYGM